MKFIFGHEETINMIHELLTWRQPTLLGRPSQQSVILKKYIQNYPIHLGIEFKLYICIYSVLNLNANLSLEWYTMFQSLFRPMLTGKLQYEQYKIYQKG